MEKETILFAMKRFKVGDRPYVFKTPAWYVRSFGGELFPLKYIYAMAAGLDPVDVHTNDAKKAVLAAGFELHHSIGVVRPNINVQQSFWWVNHKQTHEDEYAGGYIWSPKSKRNGSLNETYTNLTKAKVGDIVVSYADGYVKAFGIITAESHDARIPESHWEAAEYWGQVGWSVSIDWAMLTKFFRPKSYIADIGPLLPVKYSPLRMNGDGNQNCYLARISEELGNLLLRLGAEQCSSNEQIVNEIQVCSLDSIGLKILSDSDIEFTERDQVVKSRLGQGLFKQRVSQVERKCRLTGVDSSAFLIASHIKPWRDCDNQERLDGNNGFLLSPHIDKLFDRGWISFSDSGELLVADAAREILLAWGVPAKANVGCFNEGQKKYLQYHRDIIFVGGL